MKNILWFSEISKDSIPKVGGKGANLGEMYNIKLPIPPGFIVSAGAYKKFLEKTGIKNKISSLLKNLGIEDTERIHEGSEKVQEVILNVNMPNEIKEDIIKAYDIMNVNIDVYRSISKDALKIIKAGRDLPFVAVRSSATAEDLPQYSFAGLQATFLNVKGNEKLVNAVQQCWASLFTPRAIYYRIKNNFPHEKVLIAVVVQKMISSDASGVMFTINPSTNNENEIVIETGFGLGESIVGGEITPDSYIVDKNELKIKSKKVNKQKFMYTRDEAVGRTIKKNLSIDKGSAQKLTDDQIVKLAEYGKIIDKHYEKPMDIEFAVENNKLYIVQARPVTTQKSVGEKKEEVIDVKGELILEGLAASPGVASGKVKIVHDVNELKKVEKGDILVATMTDPDMVPAMEKAVAIVTDEGGSTCFGGNTIVLTNKGFKTIEEVYNLIKEQINLFIFSYDYINHIPKWKKILNSGKSKRFTIRVCVSQKGTMMHNSLDITPDHKMFTYNNRNMIKKQLDLILKDNEYLCLVDKLPKLILERSEEKFAYLVGALLSDGYCKVDMYKTGNPRRGRIVFTQKQTESKEIFINTVKEYFSEIFNEEFSMREKYSNSNFRGRIISSVATDFTCSKLEPALELLKISQNLDVWLMTMNEESALNFLAGLIDGDGCYYQNRLHIYIGKESVLRGVIVSCLKIGIVPQVTTNRNIHHVQILENIEEILKYTKRVNGMYNRKTIGTKFFAAKQILDDVIDEVNTSGKIKPYVKNNLLLDVNKIINRIIHITKSSLKKELINLINSNTRMHRVSKLEDIGITDVYNLEVEADNELDHNYVVFTKKYTPILVSNSHAAIVSRELGIPAIVGSEKATEILKDDDLITVDGTNGKVYRGTVEIEHEETEIVDISGIETVTKVKVNCDIPSQSKRAASTGADGIGLFRIEFIIAENRIHPAKYIRDGKEDEYCEMLYKGIKETVENFKNKPVWIRTSDIRTDEYRNLEGGDEEPHEDNPMLGWHGIRRGLDDIEILKAEFKAIKRLYDEGFNNIGVMLPFVISVDEVKRAKVIMEDIGLKPLDDIEFGVMCETPASVWIIEDLCKEGISFVSFGTNDLTQTTLGVDRNNERLQKIYNELHPAVLRSIKHVIDICKKHDVKTSICGQAGSNPEMVEKLVRFGIDSISANIDAVGLVKNTVAKVEKRMLLDAARDKL